MQSEGPSGDAPPSPPMLTQRVQSVLQDAPKPLTFAEIKKGLKQAGVPVSGKGKVTDEEIERELKSPGVHVYPPPSEKGKPKYWHQPPKTVAEHMAETVRENVEKLGDEPVSESRLGKPGGAKATPELLQAFNEVVEQLIAEGKLFRHGSKLGKHKPQSEADKIPAAVRAKVDALGDEPVSESQLGKPSGKKATPEVMQAFEATIEQLIAERKLFRHRGKFGRKEPEKPKWFETRPLKKPFDALLKSAWKIVEDERVSNDELLKVLREKLTAEKAAPAAAQKTTAAPESEVTAPAKAEPDLRTVLKEAYDHLCKLPDFSDKLVELPSLFHEASDRVEQLTVERFHDTLEAMSNERMIELHVLNEVHLAKEPDLAIHRDDRLYYYARWN